MFKIQEIFSSSYSDYCARFQPSSDQAKAARSIMDCKSARLGCNISTCSECGHVQYHYNSCRDRHCPCCQAVRKELWIDARRSEVIDAPYFHMIFTLPAELNPLVYANQPLLYGLLHKCSANTILELASDKKYLGATPGIIQVLHTWGQKLNYHPHIHAIVSGAGLTSVKQLAVCGSHFFIPESILGSMFRGKFMDAIHKLYQAGRLSFPDSCRDLQDPCQWYAFKDALYRKTWVPHIKETFNGFGNAIDYLGRYTFQIAISNSRILSVDVQETTFTAKNYRTGERETITLTNIEFIRRFLMHVLPSGFQKIRYYGFLNNRNRKRNLRILFRIQGQQRFRSMYAGMGTSELIQALWGVDICLCPCCGDRGMKYSGRTYNMRD